MRCEQIRETFIDSNEPPEHVSECAECRTEWDIHVALRQFAAPRLGAEFDQNVLTSLDALGYFEPSPPSIWERVAKFCESLFPKLAVAACLLLLLWMSNLATSGPPSDSRSLQPGNAQMWSSLPDAMPPESLPGVSPSGGEKRLVKGDRP